MKCSSPIVLLLSLLLCAQALRLPQLPSRRAAIGAIGSAILLPVSAQARNPLDTSSEVTYKKRNYGNDEDGPESSAPKKKVTSCEDGQRLQPDGFGGKRCVGEVKSVGQIAGDAAKEKIDNLVGGGSSDPMAGARMSQAVATKAASKPPPTTKSSAPTKPLTMDELIANSIEQKAGVLGRPLNAEEQEEMAVKVKKLFAL
jgi:hypothetical protein